MEKEKTATKLCKHCKTEIASTARICPNCKKKQGMPGYLTFIFVIVVLGIVVAATGCSTPSNSTSSPQQPNQEENSKDINTEDNNLDKTEVDDIVPEEEQNTETMGQKNALSKAGSYLDFSAFSYDGLIEQLQYEGFTAEEAVYAVDNCGADWNEQAAKKAESYLELSSFSRSGLIEQLEFEGFTSEQAEYGVKAVGY